MGVLGFWVSNRMGVPMAASWHTNLHEYAGRRVYKALQVGQDCGDGRTSEPSRAHGFLPAGAFRAWRPIRAWWICCGERTGRASVSDETRRRFGSFCSSTEGGRAFLDPGYVGRLTAEKNVRAFAGIERASCWRRGERNFRMLLVGDGSEREWLRQHLQFATRCRGFLENEELARAFSGMDAFVFPSRTDTFGLVILEAMASGVPVVLSPEAGRHVGIQDGVQGMLSENLGEAVLNLMRFETMREEMGVAAVRFAQTQSWNAVFEDLYETYEVALEVPEVRGRIKSPVLVPA